MLSNLRAARRGAAALLFPGVVVRAYHGAGRSTYGSNGGVAMTKRIAVVGAGAIGGYTGGHLAHNGFDVTLIDPWPAHIEAIRSEGLAIEGITAEEFIRVRPKTLHLTEVQSLAKEKPIDIALISVKSYDTEWATLMIRQYLAPGGYVVSLQNCINEERIAGIVGWGKTVGAIAAILSAELYAPAASAAPAPRTRRATRSTASARCTERSPGASRSWARSSAPSTPARSPTICGASAGRSCASTACTTGSRRQAACPATRCARTSASAVSSSSSAARACGSARRSATASRTSPGRTPRPW